MNAASEPHPEVQAFLGSLEALDAQPLCEYGPETARQLFEQLSAEATGPDVGEVTDLTIPGYRDGPEVPVRVYTPDAPGPYPTLLFCHGGGFVLGSLETHDVLCRHLTVATGAQVVAVDYRLAPEHPFPAGLADTYAGLRWVGGETGADPPADLDPAGSLVVAGDSAGATLVTAACLVARDLDGSGVDYQALVYPAVARDEDWPSMAQFAEGYFLTRPDMEWFHESYLPDPLDRANPYANPLEAASHADLPPATVVTAGFDPLRDQGVAYAEALGADGVEVTHRHYEDMIHGFLSMLEGEVSLDRAAEALEAITGDLEDAMR